MKRFDWHGRTENTQFSSAKVTIKPGGVHIVLQDLLECFDFAIDHILADLHHAHLPALDKGIPGFVSGDVTLLP
jgi:hypothetical protein